MSMYMFRDSRVSIHASVKDATCSHRRKQPVQQVSIHASVKDATVKWGSHPLAVASFNPRICKRCDRAPI